MSKLRKIHVIIIGVLVCVIAAVGMYFVLIKKATEARDATKADCESKISQGGTPQNVQFQKDDVVKANMEVAEARVNFDRYMREKMPNISLEDRKAGMLALWHEQSEVLGPLLIHWIQGSGVRLASSIAIQAPPADPNSINYDDVTPIRIDIGRVKVEGDFAQLMKHIRMWNSCNRLVLIDQPTLSGQSPNLACEYNLSVFIFPRTRSGPTIEMAGSGAAGGMGGPGMPMPGMAGPGGIPTPGTGLPPPSGAQTPRAM
jgi:hypothetical protein